MESGHEHHRNETVLVVERKRIPDTRKDDTSEEEDMEEDWTMDVVDPGKRVTEFRVTMATLCTLPYTLRLRQAWFVFRGRLDVDDGTEKPLELGPVFDAMGNTGKRELREQEAVVYLSELERAVRGRGELSMKVRVEGFLRESLRTCYGMRKRSGIFRLWAIVMGGIAGPVCAKTAVDRWVVWNTLDTDNASCAGGLRGLRAHVRKQRGVLKSELLWTDVLLAVEECSNLTLLECRLEGKGCDLHGDGGCLESPVPSALVERDGFWGVTGNEDHRLAYSSGAPNDATLWNCQLHRRRGASLRGAYGNVGASARDCELE